MIRIKNRNWIISLFWFGTNEVGIQKNAKLIFLKEEKQQRSGYAAPTAAEATFQNGRESELTTILSFSIHFG